MALGSSYPSLVLPEMPLPLGTGWTASTLTYQNPVKGRGRPASLHMSEDGHAGVVSQLLHHQLREISPSGDTEQVRADGLPLEDGPELGSRFLFFLQIYWRYVLIPKVWFLKECLG